MSADPAFSVRPKYDQLIELLDTLVNWQKFGTFLPGIKSEDIQVIERDNRGTDKQKATLFSKWLSVCPEASWQDVMSALQKSRELALESLVYQKINIFSSTSNGQLSSPQGRVFNLLKLCYYHFI